MKRKMKNVSKLLIIWLFCLAFAERIVYADGMTIIEDPGERLRFSEDQQIAVIKIYPDCTYDMRLFVSFSDLRTNKNDVTYILPLYEKPLDFQAAEQHISSFEVKNTLPLDKYLLIARSEGKGGESKEVVPEKIVTTDNTVTEIYNVNSEETLDKIILKYKISDKLKQRLLKYIKNYLYILKIRTKEVIEDSEKQLPHGNGICFSLKGKLLDKDGIYKYTYPLSTGELWENPIKITKVYVSAPKSFNIWVDSPNYGEVRENLADIKLEDYSKKITIKENRFSDALKVYRIVYLNSNPSEDIEIGLSEKTHFDINEKVPLNYSLNAVYSNWPSHFKLEEKHSYNWLFSDDVAFPEEKAKKYIDDDFDQKIIDLICPSSGNSTKDQYSNSFVQQPYPVTKDSETKVGNYTFKWKPRFEIYMNRQFLFIDLKDKIFEDKDENGFYKIAFNKELKYILLLSSKSNELYIFDVVNKLIKNIAKINGRIEQYPFFDNSGNVTFNTENSTYLLICQDLKANIYKIEKLPLQQYAWWYPPKLSYNQSTNSVVFYSQDIYPFGYFIYNFDTKTLQRLTNSEGMLGDVGGKHIYFKDFVYFYNNQLSRINTKSKKVEVMVIDLNDSKVKFIEKRYISNLEMGENSMNEYNEMLKNNYHVSSEKVSDCKDYRDFEDNYEPFGYNYIHWEEKVPRFEGKYLFDEKITTTWKPEKPLNEWINMVFPKKEIKKIQIFAGNGQSDELYYDNNRVKEMRS